MKISLFIITASGAALIGTLLLSKSVYRAGYKRGFNTGVSKTLDSVSAILNNHVSDTTITELIIKDTNVYYLSKKCLNP